MLALGAEQDHIAGFRQGADDYLLWGNCLLPVELAQRGAWEVRVFFAIWALSQLHAGCRPYLQTWREQLGLAALLCLTLPLLSAATVQRPWAEPMRLYVELTAIACSALLVFCAWRVGQLKARVVPRRQTSTVAQVQ